MERPAPVATGSPEIWAETVIYAVVGETGPPHDRMFTVSARIAGEQVATGAGRSKKDAEQQAARLALAEISV